MRAVSSDTLSVTQYASKPAQLAEVARGVGRVPGAAAGPAEEQPSAALARGGENVDDRFDDGVSTGSRIARVSSRNAR